MKTRRLDCQVAGTSSSALAGQLRPVSVSRSLSYRRQHGTASWPMPTSRFGVSHQPDTSSRDVSCDAHCAIPWEIAEKSLVDPAGKDACGVSTWDTGSPLQQASSSKLM